LTPNQVTQLAAAAHGFVSADLAALVNEAALCALRRAVGGSRGALAATVTHTTTVAAGPGSGDGSATAIATTSSSSTSSSSSKLSVDWPDFQTAQARIKPSALREVAVELPRVAWSDVGGLGCVKQRLKEAVEWPQKHPEALLRLGAQPPRGILLYGPPGSVIGLGGGVGGWLFLLGLGACCCFVLAVGVRTKPAAPSGPSNPKPSTSQSNHNNPWKIKPQLQQDAPGARRRL